MFILKIREVVIFYLYFLLGKWDSEVYEDGAEHRREGRDDFLCPRAVQDNRAERQPERSV